MLNQTIFFIQKILLFDFIYCKRTLNHSELRKNFPE